MYNGQKVYANINLLKPNALQYQHTFSNTIHSDTSYRVVNAEWLLASRSLCATNRRTYSLEKKMIYPTNQMP